LGLRASDTSTVVFEDCRIPKENLLGAPGSGFVDAMKVLDGGRISIAALGIGMAQGAYEAALHYSKQRKQFGKPSPTFKPFSSNWPIWQPRSMPRGCSSIVQRG
jgi:alkylation response protein AidB-like acyl-CoA dehydrogenase